VPIGTPGLNEEEKWYRDTEFWTKRSTEAGDITFLLELWREADLGPVFKMAGIKFDIAEVILTQIEFLRHPSRQTGGEFAWAASKMGLKLLGGVGGAELVVTGELIIKGADLVHWFFFEHLEAKARLEAEERLETFGKEQDEAYKRASWESSLKARHAAADAALYRSLMSGSVRAARPAPSDVSWLAYQRVWSMIHGWPYAVAEELGLGAYWSALGPTYPGVIGEHEPGFEVSAPCAMRSCEP
jgi:hypothetical protein